MKIRSFFQASKTKYGYIAIHNHGVIHHFVSVSEIPDYLLNKKIIQFEIGFHYDVANGAEFVIAIII